MAFQQHTNEGTKRDFKMKEVHCQAINSSLPIHVTFLKKTLISLKHEEKL